MIQNNKNIWNTVFRLNKVTISKNRQLEGKFKTWTFFVLQELLSIFILAHQHMNILKIEIASNLFNSNINKRMNNEMKLLLASIDWVSALWRLCIFSMNILYCILLPIFVPKIVTPRIKVHINERAHSTHKNILLIQLILCSIMSIINDETNSFYLKPIILFQIHFTLLQHLKLPSLLCQSALLYTLEFKIINARLATRKKCQYHFEKCNSHSI